MPKIYLCADALISNFRLLKSKTQGALIPVLKADAYGHGALFALEALCREGVRLFAVATAYEAQELLDFLEKSKYCFTNQRVFVMSAVEPEALFSLLSARVVLSVHSPAYARFLSSTIARYKEKALLPDRFRLAVHLKLETGMHRTGLRTEESIRSVLSLPHLSVEGVYSHLASAADTLYTEEQHRRFLALRAALPDGILTHLSASEGLLRYGDFSLSAARTGLALYGITPEDISLPLLPVMRFSARVTALLRVKTGERVGYGCVRTDRPRRLAVIDAGYADGIPPTAQKEGWVTVGDRRCPFFGAVCMDRATLDIGDAPLREGDEITLFGKRTGDTAAFAKGAGVSPYVLLSLRSRRTQRIYTSE